MYRDCLVWCNKSEEIGNIVKHASMNKQIPGVSYGKNTKSVKEGAKYHNAKAVRIYFDKYGEYVDYKELN